MNAKQEALGQLIDRLENLQYALEIPMPAQFHIDQFKTTLPGLVAEFKTAFTDLTGENPGE